MKNLKKLKKKLKKIGINTVYLYEGTLPKSGKQVILFAGYTLVHRSISADKSDLLVHLDSRAIIRAYPKGTDRSKVLDDLANNIERLQSFLNNQERYILETRPKVLKNTDNAVEKSYECTMTKYSDGSLVKKRNNKKSYNVGTSTW